MNLDAVPLARQVDYVFRQLEDELRQAPAGTVLIHIRNNAIGKFGFTWSNQLLILSLYSRITSFGLRPCPASSPGAVSIMRYS